MPILVHTSRTICDSLYDFISSLFHCTEINSVFIHIQSNLSVNKINLINVIVNKEGQLDTSYETNHF